MDNERRETGDLEERVAHFLTRARSNPPWPNSVKNARMGGRERKGKGEKEICAKCTTVTGTLECLLGSRESLSRRFDSRPRNKGDMGPCVPGYRHLDEPAFPGQTIFVYPTCPRADYRFSLASRDANGEARAKSLIS